MSTSREEAVEALKRIGEAGRKMQAELNPKTVKVEAPRAAFDEACGTTLRESLEIQAERGDAYGDSWGVENIVATFTKNVLQELFGKDSGVIANLTNEQLRLIMCAALVDVKDARIKNGRYHPDSIKDGINYRAALAYWLEAYRNNQYVPF